MAKDRPDTVVVRESGRNGKNVIPLEHLFNPKQSRPRTFPWAVRLNEQQLERAQRLADKVTDLTEREALPARLLLMVLGFSLTHEKEFLAWVRENMKPAPTSG